MLLLTDLDETVLQFSDTLQSFLESEFGLVSKLRLKDHHDIPQMYGISIEETLDCVRRFHRSEWMRCLPPDPSAVAVLPELYERGYRFVAITACLNEPSIVEARRANLEVFGMPWEDVRCLGLTRCKKAALECYPPSIWVDDLMDHAATGADVGHRSFLLDKPYNSSKDHPAVTRVGDWHEIARHLISYNDI